MNTSCVFLGHLTVTLGLEPPYPENYARLQIECCVSPHLYDKAALQARLFARGNVTREDAEEAAAIKAMEDGDLRSLSNTR